MQINQEKKSGMEVTLERDSGKVVNGQCIFFTKDKMIGFGYILNYSLPKVAIAYADFYNGSPLSYQLSLFEGNSYQ